MLRYGSFHFPYGPPLNLEAFIKCLEEEVLPSHETVAARRLNIWQQNSASCHTNRWTQCCLSENVYITNKILPPNSSDCQPLVNYETCCWPRKLTKFRGTPKMNWRWCTKTVKKDGRRFRSRLKAVVRANSDFFE